MGHLYIASQVVTIAESTLFGAPLLDIQANVGTRLISIRASTVSTSLSGVGCRLGVLSSVLGGSGGASLTPVKLDPDSPAARNTVEHSSTAGTGGGDHEIGLGEMWGGVLLDWEPPNFVWTTSWHIKICGAQYTATDGEKDILLSVTWEEGA